MYGYIYKTTNLVNGKIYIGQHKAEKYDKSYYGSGKILKLAIDKYGIENFSNTVLCYCESKKELDKLERQLIKQYNSTNSDIGYNIAKGGDGGDTFSNMSESDKLKRLENLRINGFFTTATKEQQSAMSKKSWETRRKNGNDKFSEDSKLKMRNSHLGKTLTKEQIDKSVKSRKGYKHSEETKLKISKSNKGKNKGKIVSDTTKDKIRNAVTGDKNGFYNKHHSEEAKKLIGSYNKDRFKNKIWINNSIENKRIEISDLEKYLSIGYKKGRIKCQKV